MIVRSLTVYAKKERASSSQKESICQQFSREHGYYVQMDYDMKRDGWMPQDGRHGIATITPHIDPRDFGQCRHKSGGRFYVNHPKDTNGRTVLNKWGMKMINGATTGGLEKEDIHLTSYNVCTFVFEEEWLALDSDGLFIIRDKREELKNAEENELDLIWPNVDGDTGSADGLKTYEAVVMATEEELVRELNMATKQLQNATVQRFEAGDWADNGFRHQLDLGQIPADYATLNHQTAC